METCSLAHVTMFQPKMAEFSDDGDGENPPDLVIEGIINATLEEDEMNLFITPSNTNKIDSDKEEDGFFIDAVQDDSKLNFSVEDTTIFLKVLEKRTMPGFIVPQTRKLLSYRWM